MRVEKPVLSRKEAGKAGSGGGKITSGRDSARAIVRMLKRNKDSWTANDWKWRPRSRSTLINRMKGAKGKMREPDGTPTRKLLAQRYGHNPENEKVQRPS
jgi:hypothetical protein